MRIAFSRGGFFMLIFKCALHFFVDVNYFSLLLSSSFHHHVHPAATSVLSRTNHEQCKCCYIFPLPFFRGRIAGEEARFAQRCRLHALDFLKTARDSLAHSA